jgi:nucleoside-diphosphate-sugar epimerase
MKHEPIKNSLLRTLAKREYRYTQDLPSTPDPSIGTVLVTGASGYIGGRLVPELLSRGYRVRVMVRGRSTECGELWPQTETAFADALKIEDLKKALEGVHTAYYLIHSLLLGTREFEAADIQAAINFRDAAEEAGVKRIIYLGGLGDDRTKLAPLPRTSAPARSYSAWMCRTASPPANSSRRSIISACVCRIRR